ncbi:MAG TPA: nucleotide sugar dehydrogenase [Caulobacteraceae bacterium]|jgi:UDP-N-acetyl-D-glucosamine dehydrogenase|nr:nucleotide sugar dehydrogenase [Caulobacteraceae bacterium]
MSTVSPLHSTPQRGRDDAPPRRPRAPDFNPGARLAALISERRAIVGVMGLGYVGLPLAVASARSSFHTVGFDIDPAKARMISEGRSYIGAVASSDLGSVVDQRALEATIDFRRLAECDVVIICVPTPLTRHREPDLYFIEATAEVLAGQLRPGQLVVLESTTYPGTTREVLKPILQRSGLVAGEDFFLAFSPEREDPGNAAFDTATIPKVVAGDGAEALQLVRAFYGAVVERVVPVSSTDVAEAVKLTENVFRAVNIALVNELKMIFQAMGIDIWEVVDAAKTKPFGYMAFYPGPGLGGHCIPIDPFYLTWKSREQDICTRFIELAGEINVAMPRYVVDTLARALDDRFHLSLSAARVLVIGLAYKKDVTDTRESPSLKLIELLEERGTSVDYHDPHVPEAPLTREHPRLAGRGSAPIDPEHLAAYDAVLIATDHDAIDYRPIRDHARLIVDTRNAMHRRGLDCPQVVKA